MILYLILCKLHIYKKRKPLGQVLHRKAMDYFKEYMIVGGMPQAVEMYANTRDFEKVDRVKRNILNLYREDIRKYAEDLNLKVEQIFDTIPSQLQKHEKKFNISSLDENARYRNYEGAFYWLNDECLVNIAYNTTEPNIGLDQRIDSNALKCYMADTMEIDFLISKDLITSKHNIVPIEVKSGDRYTFTSLNKLNNKYKEYLAQGIILHTKDLKEEGVLYLPLYMTSLL